MRKARSKTKKGSGRKSAHSGSRRKAGADGFLPNRLVRLAERAHRNARFCERNFPTHLPSGPEPFARYWDKVGRGERKGELRSRGVPTSPIRDVGSPSEDINLWHVRPALKSRGCLQYHMRPRRVMQHEKKKELHAQLMAPKAGTTLPYPLAFFFFGFGCLLSAFFSCFGFLDSVRGASASRLCIWILLFLPTLFLFLFF